MTLQAIEACRGRLRHEGGLQLCGWKVKYHIHQRAAVDRHRAAIEVGVAIDSVVQQRRFGLVVLFDCRQPTQLFEVVEHMTHHVHREAVGGVVQ